jgi:thiamine-phosphate pyrophosphorylase
VSATSDRGAALRARLPALVFVADEARLRGRDISEVVSAAVSGGADIVQLRAKDLSHGEICALAAALRGVTANRALFFVNSDVEAAIEVAADGVHLPEEGSTTEAVRSRVGEGTLISRAVHSVAAAVGAKREGADFLQAGTVFQTASKPGADTLGIGGLAEVCRAVSIPCIAIGGITTENAADVVRAGASGVAVVGAIGEASDPASAAAALQEAVSATRARA